MKKIRTAIIGATGFTGSELARLVHLHPNFELVAITSESHKGKKFSDVHPQFFGLVDLPLVSASEIEDGQVDLVFLGLPHGVSMEYVKDWYHKDLKIVDLSGDYRLSSPEVYEEWYPKKHVHPEGFEQAVYGMPEIFSNEIKNAKLVANPGCYPTSAILAVNPLIKGEWVRPETLVIDSKSGTTGAGIKAKPATHFSQVNDNFNAYGIAGHRHTIEIEEILGIAAGHRIILQFTPHLLPVDRGILTTTYASRRSNKLTNREALREYFDEFYADKPFVRVRNTPPSIKEVRATNFCDLYPTFDPRTGNIIVISVIDNLMKGAAGQAIHNANLMFDLDEQTGLDLVPIKP
ncbi:MAG: N-acetyl-gamma-glutamyl-phosphate reductase [Saprospirales bacterium]|nr:MAG: N-acetyl-gamma-glutamyl-phosphate reductase [Saprospirales bacterium]